MKNQARARRPSTRAGDTCETAERLRQIREKSVQVTEGELRALLRSVDQTPSPRGSIIRQAFALQAVEAAVDGRLRGRWAGQYGSRQRRADGARARNDLRARSKCRQKRTE